MHPGLNTLRATRSNNNHQQCVSWVFGLIVVILLVKNKLQLCLHSWDCRSENSEVQNEKYQCYIQRHATMLEASSDFTILH